MLLKKEFTFDAAHRLERYRGKCEALHGHTYRLAVTLKGHRDDDDMVFDFTELKKLVTAKVLDRLDHAYLNDVMDQPTAENIALWVWDELDGEVNRPNCKLHTVQVWETATSSVIVDREDAESR
ncbi:6-carboxytetrahydropterin synthase QueD [Dethiosulfovibrio salsuginis]|uniref:6-carboxy-5,6,7,8-tetrahydropterin synthase n=1 Tax=Dethiosulfovibrio salsuginis TaxID=561720 RepID=A0A1X7KEJ9_9BACT|nr:6-carboxytetrahydropterin synthase QueD [Dethiosulfovibrio salsuginis]SMG39319.1 6-pyruvoyltetrahydropterin/6-carboxytetrahydropterin synthase [Dethiosulfovibrio salsuginis]